LLLRAKHLLVAAIDRRCARRTSTVLPGWSGIAGGGRSS
jgi:hypothetical protein